MRGVAAHAKLVRSLDCCARRLCCPCCLLRPVRLPRSSPWHGGSCRRATRPILHTEAATTPGKRRQAQANCWRPSPTPHALIEPSSPVARRQPASLVIICMHPVDATTLLLQGHHCPITTATSATEHPSASAGHSQHPPLLSCHSATTMRADRNSVSVKRLLHG